MPWPDPRTQSVLVTASKDTMTQIEQIIYQMDQNQSGHVQVYVYKTQNADVLDLIGSLTDLFQPADGRTSSASTSTQQNALQQRMQQAAQHSSITAAARIGDPNIGNASGEGIP